MSKLKDKLSQFMYGRNGNDSLNHFIFFLYIVSFIVYLFWPHFSILIIETILIFIFIYRIMSKKLYKRQRENDIYTNLLLKIKQPIKRFFNRIKDRKTHVYRKCQNCKKVLRLRKVKGEHTVKCPICNHNFKVKV